MKQIPLKMQLLAAETELAEMNALFDLQRKRMTEAVKEWQTATGETYNPDLGQLLTWLIENRKAMIALYDSLPDYSHGWIELRETLETVKRLKGGKK